MNNNIDVKHFEAEREELIKARNSLFHHYALDIALFTELYNAEAEEVQRNAEYHDSLADQIRALKDVKGNLPSSRKARNWFQSEVLQKEGDTTGKMITKTLQIPLREYFFAIAQRIAAIDLLINKYEPMDSWTVKCSAAAVEASRTFRRRVETNIGWRNNIDWVVGTPGNFEIEETPDDYHKRVTFKATAEVDGSYIDVIKANNIDVVDIGGKACLTMKAEEITEHELVEDGVKLFKAKVMYTKVARGVNTWRLLPGEAREIINVEDKYIAVQSLDSSPDIIATGKDQSWAIRTMRGRMKKKMMKIMGL